ncbi:unnamed protein product, partial [Rotaria magnacalcarata]
SPKPPTNVLSPRENQQQIRSPSSYTPDSIPSCIYDEPGNEIEIIASESSCSSSNVADIQHVSSSIEYETSNKSNLNKNQVLKLTLNHHSMEEDVKNDLPSSPTSSEEEIPIPHPQNSSLDITTRSPTTLSSYSMSYPETKELNKVILPYPLRLDSNYIYRIGLKPNEFIHYCQTDQIESMFDDPMDLIDNFLQDRLRKGLDIGVHQECLDHLNYVKQIYDDNESLLDYVYDYIEAQIMKLINAPGFESAPDNQWSTILYPTFDTSTLASIDYSLNVYMNRIDANRGCS